MIIPRISKLGIIKSRLFLPVSILTRSRRCPSDKNASKSTSPCGGQSGKSSGSEGSDKNASMPKNRPRCPKSTSPCGRQSGKGRGSEGSSTQLIRPMTSGKCRLGFIPDEWFVFFQAKTGVSGPYLLLLGIANYLASKEIFVMEHEYYSGLSILLLLYLITTRIGDQIGAALDKEVDEKFASFQKSRDDAVAYYQSMIKEYEMAQLRAKGQKGLMDAKKENIALQLEAAYRERVMMVYKAVRDRMEYHVRKHRATSLIEQRWMVEWIVKKVHESITPEFRKRAFESAIRELDAIASRTK